MVSKDAREQTQEVRRQLGAGYRDDVLALQQMLESYFEGAAGCTTKLGKTISPIGVTPRGGKILKVRWGLPAGGKSGGLRLCVVAYCTERLVIVCHAQMRRDADDAALLTSSAEADERLKS